MEPTRRSKQLGRTITKAREAKGLSLRGLAEQIRMTHSFLARLEAGRFRTVSPDNLRAIAKALELPAEDLFTLSGYKVPESLPAFEPYLRTRYGEELPEQVLDQLNEYFELLRGKYTDDVDDEPAADSRAVRPVGRS
jgi:transcriptional regulator with XRE-family HTH domain